jgi:tRNA (cytidine/uridine-2'-O-)-methyltransferase
MGHSIDIALFEPQIPPNTGNILRLCANTQSHLHLIQPMGFEINEKTLKRAALDYITPNCYTIYPDIDTFLAKQIHKKIWSASTKASTPYHKIRYSPGNILLFGAETHGLPVNILKNYASIRIPMAPDQRSLNLSNSVAIILYHALYQNDFFNLR